MMKRNVARLDQVSETRRSCLATLLAFASIPVYAHTPYKQWAVYRQKHLLIGCHKDLPETYELAKTIVSKLESALPAASARVARAPATTRLASLLSTDQLNIAVLSRESATEMAAGEGIFAAYGSIPLTTLLMLENHVMVGHARILDHHSWQITAALSSISGGVNNEIMPVLPWHAGSAQFIKGQPMPHSG